MGTPILLPHLSFGLAVAQKAEGGLQRPVMRPASGRLAEPQSAQCSWKLGDSGTQVPAASVLLSPGSVPSGGAGHPENDKTCGSASGLHQSSGRVWEGDLKNRITPQEGPSLGLDTQKDPWDLLESLQGCQREALQNSPREAHELPGEGPGPKRLSYRAH